MALGAPTISRWRAGSRELRGGAPVELARARTVDLDGPARAEFVVEFAADFTRQVMPSGRKVPLGVTGFTPRGTQPIARVTAITHRNGAVFQALLTAIGGEWPPTENTS